jgi:hypothetical protein
MSSIRERLLTAIEPAPEPLLEQMLTFLEFLTARSAAASHQVSFIGTDAADDENFDPDGDSNEQILADLKVSLHQAKTGQAFPLLKL